MLTMKQFFIVLSLFSFSILQVTAQTKSLKNSPPLSEAAPETVGMSSERLSRLDGVLQNGVTQHSVPGVAAIVVRVIIYSHKR